MTPARLRAALSSLLTPVLASLAFAACGSSQTPAGFVPPVPTAGINPECLKTDAAGRSLFRVGCLVGEPEGFKISLRDLGPVLVVPFTVQATLATSEGVSTLTCQLDEMAEAFAGRLLDHRLRVVERDKLDTVLNELHFATGDEIDQATAVRLGQLLSAHVLIFGTYELEAEFQDLGTVHDCGTILKGSSRVTYQAVRVRAIELEHGEVLGRLKLLLARNAATVLMPTVLAHEAADRIVRRLQEDELE